MGLAMAGAILAALAVSGGGDRVRQEVPGAVRPEDGDLRKLIVRGVERSETFRNLIARLDAADVVVYVRFSRCVGGVRSCLLWASQAPDVRRLLIRVDRFGGSDNSLTAALAHELQHACEVAATPEIRDLASFQKAFEQRGWKGTHGFETQEAKEVDRRVLTELTRRRGRPTSAQ